MFSEEEVERNVRAALEGLGLVARDPGLAAREEAALARVREILAPVHGVTWASGRPENN
jgi:hypothetical protein